MTTADLWHEVDIDHQAVALTRAKAQAYAALADKRAFVCEATSAQAYQDRLALIDSDVRKAVSAAAGDGVAFAITHSAVLDAIGEEYAEVMAERAKKAAALRRQREAQARRRNYVDPAELAARRQRQLRAAALTKQAESYSVAAPASFIADFDKTQQALENGGWVVDLGGGEMGISPSAPPDLVSVYQGLLQMGYANGYFAKSAKLARRHEGFLTNFAALHTAASQAELDRLFSGLDPKLVKHLQQYVPYMLFGPNYSRGITENVMDLIKFYGWNPDFDDKSVRYVQSKLDAHMDAINGGDGNWFYDRDQGRYVQRLFGSKQAIGDTRATCDNCGQTLFLGSTWTHQSTGKAECADGQGTAEPKAGSERTTYDSSRKQAKFVVRQRGTGSGGGDENTFDTREEAEARKDELNAQYGNEYIVSEEGDGREAARKQAGKIVLTPRPGTDYGVVATFPDGDEVDYSLVDLLADNTDYSLDIIREIIADVANHETTGISSVEIEITDPESHYFGSRVAWRRSGSLMSAELDRVALTVVDLPVGAAWAVTNLAGDHEFASGTSRDLQHARTAALKHHADIFGEDPEALDKAPSTLDEPDPNEPDDGEIPGEDDQVEIVDPLSLNVGDTVTVSYTMGTGDTGEVEAVFVRNEDDIAFFSGPNGEFGVAERDGVWIDSEGNQFSFSFGSPDETGDTDPNDDGDEKPDDEEKDDEPDAEGDKDDGENPFAKGAYYINLSEGSNGTTSNTGVVITAINGKPAPIRSMAELVTAIGAIHPDLSPEQVLDMAKAAVARKREQADS